MMAFKGMSYDKLHPSWSNRATSSNVLAPFSRLLA